MKTLRLIISIIILASLFTYPLAKLGFAQTNPPNLIDALRQQTDGQVRVGYHFETGKVNFIGTDAAHPIPLEGINTSISTDEEAAMLFLAQYGGLFGLADPALELSVMRIRQVDDRYFLRYQQIYQGVPVLGGELIIQLDSRRNLLSAGGEILPSPGVQPNPEISAETAQQTALQSVAERYSLDVSSLEASQPELWIYNPAIMGGSQPRLTSLVWRMEVSTVDLLPVRELVLVDAKRNFVALAFNQLDTAKWRDIYDNNNSFYGQVPGPNLVRSEGDPASGIMDVDNAYDYAGATYDYYFTTHVRDSLDGAGMDLISTVRYCPDAAHCPYLNAFWNGAQMVYGAGFASADDVVGHEMTHGVTDHESRLFYYYQSGAINEAFSDIWGEFIDQWYVTASDTPAKRWLMGEDLSIGAIRNMANPPAYNDPDSMTSSFYTCDPNETDGGGVHTNSGVANKAAYLLVDGGTHNGKIVTSIGMTKTAKIFYEAQTNLLTTAADYYDLYNNLQQACTNLIPSGVTTPADCLEVKDAVDATQMNMQPPSCQAREAPVCTYGQTPTTLFSDDLENPASGNWISDFITGSDAWSYPQPLGLIYATSGVYHMWGYNLSTVSDSYIKMNSGVAIPPASQAYLRFNHAFGFHDAGTNYYDGGVLEYSTNGTTWLDAGSLIDFNPYSGVLAAGSGNPLAGREAFVAESNGYISTRVNITSLAGQTVRFRFRLATNNTVSDYGWFIDDIHIYTCGTNPVLRSIYLPVVLNKSLGGGAWSTIVSENFEGTFPTGSWIVLDGDGATNGEYVWAKRNCQFFGGGYAGWAVGGGANGGALSCGSQYPNNAKSWMIYGPFSLVSANAAELRFKLWINSQTSTDKMDWFASIDGSNFYGYALTGNLQAWSDRVFDLSNVPTLGNLLGRPSVWIAFYFETDGATTFTEGAFVDDVVLRKCLGGTCTGLAGSYHPGDEAPAAEAVK